MRIALIVNEAGLVRPLQYCCETVPDLTKRGHRVHVIVLPLLDVAATLLANATRSPAADFGGASSAFLLARF